MPSCKNVPKERNMVSGTRTGHFVKVDRAGIGLVYLPTIAIIATLRPWRALWLIWKRFVTASYPQFTFAQVLPTASLIF
jgi:hypothetical protein